MMLWGRAGIAAIILTTSLWSSGANALSENGNSADSPSSSADDTASSQALVYGMDVSRLHLSYQVKGSKRLAGTNRYETSVKVSSSLPLYTGETVVLASGKNFPDALSAAAGAGSMGAPILLTEQASIPQEIQSELVRLSPRQVLLVGGTAALGPGIEAKVAQLLPDVTIWRAGGVDRYETSANVSRLLWPNREANEVFIAAGENFPDALAGGAAAAKKDAPLLLMSKNGPKEALVEELQRLNPGKVNLLGLGWSETAKRSIAEAVASSPMSSISADQMMRHINEVGGSDRYQTALVVAKRFFGGYSKAVIASGEDFPDALVAAPLAEAAGMPIVLAPAQRCVPDRNLAAYKTIKQRVIVGGTGAVPDEALTNKCTPQLAPGVVQQGTWLIHPMGWIGQPNGLTCGPTSMMMNLRYLGAERSALDGQLLSVWALSGPNYGHIGSGYSGGVAWGNMPVAMNRWMGKNIYRDQIFPTGAQFDQAVRNSFYTGRPVLVDTIETSRGPHYNGHRGWSSHILVAYRYNTADGTVGFMDPGASLRGYSRSATFDYYNAAMFAQNFLGNYGGGGHGMVF